MQSVIRGNNITLEAQYKDGTGTVQDPISPRVSIYNPINVAVVTNAVPSRISTGIYQYTYTVGQSDPTGVWYAFWQGTVDGQPLTATEYFEVEPVGSITPVVNGSYTYDLGTSVGKMRMYIDDRDLSATSSLLPLEERSAIFTDEELNAMLTDCANDVMYASARALVTISGNRQLLVQSRRIGKTVVDYGEVRKSLQDQATQLIKMSNMQPADALAEISWGDPSFRQILVNAQLRKMV
jgi:hypothetical protein